jgi:WD40 repeat protein
VTTPVARHTGLATLALLLACGTDHERLPSQPGPSPGILAHRFASDWSLWSEPVNLGMTVNSACGEQTPTLSRDQLALYFTSNRRGGFGQDTPDGCQNTTDLWVSRRASRDNPWETPVNLGTPVNTQFGEFQPDLSFDGRTLVFMAGAGRVGVGGFDIWITTRAPVGHEVEGDDGDDDDAQDKSRDHRRSAGHDRRRR